MKIFKTFLLFLVIVSSASAQDEAEVSQDSVIEDSTYYFEEEDEYYYEEDVIDKAYYKNYDSSGVMLRSFDSARVYQLKQDPEFQYGYSRASMSLWDAFWLWVARQLSDLYVDTGDSNWDNFIIYTVVIAILAYVIIRLLKLDGLKILYGRNDKKKIDYVIVEENIHEMDFEKLLADAIERRNYRLAVRLYFLYGLKMLADKHYVYWEPGKTSHEYINELSQAELKAGFRKLNYYFEYTWYGNFTVSDSLFTSVKDHFSSWRTKV